MRRTLLPLRSVTQSQPSGPQMISHGLARPSTSTRFTNESPSAGCVPPPIPHELPALELPALELPALELPALAPEPPTPEPPTPEPPTPEPPTPEPPALE